MRYLGLLLVSLSLVSCSEKECAEDMNLNNGRFPQSRSLAFHPTDANNYMIGMTFGAVITNDGENYHWICEEAVGYGGTFDPTYKMLADGKILATTFNGLRSSEDGGCSWQDVPALAGQWPEALHVAADGTIWVGTANTGMNNNVYRSTDGGETFQERNLSSSVEWFRSVVTAPSDPDIVYAAAYQTAPPASKLYRSDNGGDTWTELPTTDIDFGMNPQYVVLFGGVDHDDPDTVYARVVTSSLTQPLYRSTDGGASWSEIYELSDQIAMLVAPSDVVIIGSVFDGAYYSVDGGDNFTKATQQTNLACIASNANGEIHSCGSNWDPDLFAVGITDDNGDTWENVMRFSNTMYMAGPLSCPEGTIQKDTCEPDIWPVIGAQLGLIDPPPDMDTPVPCEPADSGCRAHSGHLWVVSLIALLILGRIRQKIVV